MKNEKSLCLGTFQEATLGLNINSANVLDRSSNYCVYWCQNCRTLASCAQPWPVMDHPRLTRNKESRWITITARQREYAASPPSLGCGGHGRVWHDTWHVTRAAAGGAAWHRVQSCHGRRWQRIWAHFCGVIRLYTSNTVICTFYMSQKSQKCDLSVCSAGAGDGVSSCQCPGRCVMQPNGLLITLQRSHQPRLNTN